VLQRYQRLKISAALESENLKDQTSMWRLLKIGMQHSERILTQPILQTDELSKASLAMETPRETLATPSFWKVRSCFLPFQALPQQRQP